MWPFTFQKLSDCYCFVHSDECCVPDTANLLLSIIDYTHFDNQMILFKVLFRIVFQSRNYNSHLDFCPILVVLSHYSILFHDYGEN